MWSSSYLVTRCGRRQTQLPNIRYHAQSKMVKVPAISSWASNDFCNSAQCREVWPGHRPLCTILRNVWVNKIWDACYNKIFAASLLCPHFLFSCSYLLPNVFEYHSGIWNHCLPDSPLSIHLHYICHSHYSFYIWVFLPIPEFNVLCFLFLTELSFLFLLNYILWKMHNWW